MARHNLDGPLFFLLFQSVLAQDMENRRRLVYDARLSAYDYVFR